MDSLFLRIFKHLLPRGKAWSLTISKILKDFFNGLANALGQPTRDFFDNIWLDIFPQTTRELQKWEDQFGLPDTGITEQQRRDRLDGEWKASGGQDPDYIQTTLREAGFDVFVHDPWDSPRPEPSGVLTYKNPQLVLRDNEDEIIYAVACGEPLAECGEPAAEAGESNDPQGYALVNKVFTSEFDLVCVCGEPDAECGEPAAEAGNYDGYIFSVVQYTISNDPDTFPYYFYIGGQTYPDLATVDSKRKNEFEELCLKICPTHIWLGMLVNYS